MTSVVGCSIRHKETRVPLGCQDVDVNSCRMRRHGGPYGEFAVGLQTPIEGGTMPVDLTLLADVPILQLLDDDERATLASLLDQRRYERDALVFHEGEPGDALFLVSAGRVEVSVTSDTGDRIVLAENERGD